MDVSIVPVVQKLNTVITFTLAVFWVCSIMFRNLTQALMTVRARGIHNSFCLGKKVIRG